MSKKGKVTGIGGVFFKCDDPEAQKQWYKEQLGFPVDEWGASFRWIDKENNKEGLTQWSTFSSETGHFLPSSKDFMFNYRVENMEALLAQLKEAGVEQVGELEEYEYGKFAWVMDPEGNKIELWEPIDGVL